VLTFKDLRFMSNLLRHIGSVVYKGVLSEVTFAIARGDKARAERLVNNGLVATLSIGGVCGVVLSAGADTILGVWTGGTVQAPLTLVLAMLATVLADLPWLAWSLPLLARNEHQLVGVLYAGSCLLAVLTAKLLLPRLGLLAVPLSLLLVDVVLYGPAYRGSTRILDSR
jgi:hypothetical protein